MNIGRRATEASEVRKLKIFVSLVAMFAISAAFNLEVGTTGLVILVVAAVIAYVVARRLPRPS